MDGLVEEISLLRNDKPDAIDTVVKYVDDNLTEIHKFTRTMPKATGKSAKNKFETWFID